MGEVAHRAVQIADSHFGLDVCVAAPQIKTAATKAAVWHKKGTDGLFRLADQYFH